MIVHCAKCNAEWDAILPLPMPLDRASKVMKGIVAAGCPSCRAFGKNVLCGPARHDAGGGITHNDPVAAGAPRR